MCESSSHSNEALAGSPQTQEAAPDSAQGPLNGSSSPAIGPGAGGKRRFVFEIGTAPPSITLKDWDTGSTLAALDEKTIGQIAPDSRQGLEEGSIDLAELLRSFASFPGASLPRTQGRASGTVLDRRAVAAPAQAKKTARKLWDLPHKLHCPIIGTCLDAAELRKLALKVDPSHARTASDYDLHLRFVGAAAQKSLLSLATQKALDKKHATHIRRFGKAKTADQLSALWSDALARGEVPGGFWAILTHPRCGESLWAQAYEEVHMLSHQIGAGQRADLKRLAETRSELSQLRRDFDSLYKRSQQQLEDREQRVIRLESELRETDAERGRLLVRDQDNRARLAALRESQTHEQVSALTKRVQQQERLLGLAEREQNKLRLAFVQAEERAATLTAEYEEKQAECAALERLIAQSVSPCDLCDSDACSDDCPNLEGRLILCVGGRNQLIDQYRALVARCNGRFDHHDGGIEDNRHRLGSMLSSADAVVCVTDCVSHGASERLKRFCKQHEKPYVFLRSSGISTFARALETVAS